MPQAESSGSDYTGFMANRTTLSALLLLLAAPLWANGQALQDAKTLAGGKSGAYDGGCTAGSCGTSSQCCGTLTCNGGYCQ